MSENGTVAPAEATESIAMPTDQEVEDLEARIDALLRQVEAEEEQARQAYEAARDRYCRAQEILARLRKNVSTKAAVRRPGGPALTAGQWSRKHVACIECGRTDRPHTSRGACDRCFRRFRYQQMKSAAGKAVAEAAS